MNIEVAGVAHREFLMKKRVYDLVKQQLDIAYTKSIREMDTPLESALRLVTDKKAG